jgi:hypothetical protein
LSPYVSVNYFFPRLTWVTQHNTFFSHLAGTLKQFFMLSSQSNACHFYGKNNRELNFLKVMIFNDIILPHFLRYYCYTAYVWNECKKYCMRRVINDFLQSVSHGVFFSGILRTESLEWVRKRIFSPCVCKYAASKWLLYDYNYNAIRCDGIKKGVE